jgi:TolB protein
VFCDGFGEEASFGEAVAEVGGGVGEEGVIAPERRAVGAPPAAEGPARERFAGVPFADAVVEAISGRPGIASSKIAFISKRSGRKEVYTADYDGANVQQMTRDGAISVSPALSPNGRFLAYTGYQSGYADLYLIDLSTGSRRPLVRAPGTNSGASFSPDSQRIALTMSRDGNPEIYVVGLGGGGGRRLTRSKGVDSSPSWSPSGGEIVYSSDAGGSPQLYRMSAGGGGGSRLGTGFGYATEPSWSPDGSKIAFTAKGAGGLQVAVLDMNGGGTKAVTSGAEAEDPVWGANSRHLIYAQGGALYLHDTFTGRRTEIIGGMGKVSEPTWSR